MAFNDDDDDDDDDKAFIIKMSDATCCKFVPCTTGGVISRVKTDYSPVVLKRTVHVHSCYRRCSYSRCYYCCLHVPCTTVSVRTAKRNKTWSEDYLDYIHLVIQRNKRRVLTHEVPWAE